MENNCNITILNLDPEAKQKRTAIVCLIAIIASLSLFFFETLTGKYPVCVVLLTLTCLCCVTAIRLLPRIGGDFFEPGLLFLLFIIMNIMPISLAALFGLNVLEFDTSAIADITVFTKVILTHIITISFFTLAYVSIATRQKLSGSSNNSTPGSLANNKVWVLIFIVCYLFVIILKILSDTHYTRWDGGSGRMSLLFQKEHSLLVQQLIVHVNKLQTISFVFACGVIVSRSRTIMTARLNLLLITVIALLFNFYVYASKGSAIIFFSAGAYADRFKWKGQLLTWRLILILFLGGLLTMHASNIIESYCQSGILPTNYKRKLLTSLEPQIINNAGVIIKWVDSGEVPIQYGANYLMAITSVLPTQIRGKKLQTLSEWFIWKLNPEHAAEGAGYAFSMIAEGYLNGKIIGLTIHSIVIGLSIAAIRYLKVTSKMNHIAPFLYCSMMPLLYKFYRVDTTNLIKRIEWNIIIVFILIFVAKTIIRAVKRNNIIFFSKKKTAVQI